MGFGGTRSDKLIRDYVSVLAKAGALRCAVASKDSQLDVRALCLIREALAYSSPLADLAS